MSLIAVDVTGADDVAARLAALPATLNARLALEFADIAAALYARVLEKLDGEVVNAGTGLLAAAITQSAEPAAARVGLDTEAAPYGAALEFGASIPAQLIAAKNAKALAFIVDGVQVFAKQVSRPAFTLPPHSFLRASLAEMAPDFLAQLEAAVGEAAAS